jgi:hypothetical protein
MTSWNTPRGTDNRAIYSSEDYCQHDQDDDHGGIDRQYCRQELYLRHPAQPVAQSPREIKEQHSDADEKH